MLKNTLSSYYNLESDRIQFRKLTEEDKIPWQEFFLNNDHLRFVAQDPSLEKKFLSDRWINYQLKHYENDNFGLLALMNKESGEFMGQAGFLVRDINGEREIEIGYSLLPKFWRKGIASEAALRLKAYGRENNVASRFISIIHKENLGSMAVARKNGMEILFDMEYMEMPVHVFGETI